MENLALDQLTNDVLGFDDEVFDDEVLDDDISGDPASASMTNDSRMRRMARDRRRNHRARSYMSRRRTATAHSRRQHQQTKQILPEPQTCLRQSSNKSNQNNIHSTETTFTGTLTKRELFDFWEYECNNRGAPQDYLNYIYDRHKGKHVSNHEMELVIKHRMIDGPYLLEKSVFLSQRRCMDHFLDNILVDPSLKGEFQEFCLPPNGQQSWWVNVQDCPFVLFLPSYIRDQFVECIKVRQPKGPHHNKEEIRRLAAVRGLFSSPEQPNSIGGVGDSSPQQVKQTVLEKERPQHQQLSSPKYAFGVSYVPTSADSRTSCSPKCSVVRPSVLKPKVSNVVPKAPHPVVTPKTVASSPKTMLV